MKIEDKLLTLIKKYSKINADNIKSTTNINELKFDSLDFLEFQVEFVTIKSLLQLLI